MYFGPLLNISKFSLFPFLISLWYIIIVLSIEFNIPYFREIVTLSFFLVIPGLLIINILSKSQVTLTMKLLSISVGLSLSFITIIGFIINYLGKLAQIKEPLSAGLLIVAYGLLILCLILILCGKGSSLSLSLNTSILWCKTDLYLTMFSLIFICLSVIGTYILNKFSDNWLLIFMLILIFIYILLISKFRDGLNYIYPWALFFIGLSLTLMNGLTSNYLLGQDVHVELFSLRMILAELQWDLPSSSSLIDACLSTSLMPAIISSLSGISDIYIYKLLYPFFVAFVPVICFYIYNKYLGNFLAFLSSFFLISQEGFLFSSQNSLRTGIAIFFLSLILLLFFDDTLDLIMKRALIPIFLFMLVISHYSTAYIFFFILSASAIFLYIYQKIADIKDKQKYFINATLALLFSIMIFVWYSQITVGFDTLVNSLGKTLISFNDLFIAEQETSKLFNSLSGQLQGDQLTVLVRRISLFIHWVTFILIFIGVINILWLFYEDKCRSNLDFYLMIILFSFLPASVVAIPFLANLYGTRAYTLSLILLSPCIIWGIEAICKSISCKRLIIPLAVIIILLQFSCATCIMHQSIGVPYSVCLNRQGNDYGINYIHDQDVWAASWLLDRYLNGSSINTDMSGPPVFLESCNTKYCPIVNRKYFLDEKTYSIAYIFLRYVNSKEMQIYPYFDVQKEPLSKFANSIYINNKIYDNSAQIFLNRNYFTKNFVALGKF